MPLLKDRDFDARCTAIRSLARLHYTSIEDFISAQIEEALKRIDVNQLEEKSDVEWTLCVLSSAEILRAPTLAPLLRRAYLNWQKSIGFANYRVATIRALSHLKTSDTVQTLIEAMNDIDPKVKSVAEKGLRR